MGTVFSKNEFMLNHAEMPHCDAVEAHSCVDSLMPNSFLSKNTTVNDKSTAGRFDPKVFVNCVLYAVDKDLRFVIGKEA